MHRYLCLMISATLGLTGCRGDGAHPEAGEDAFEGTSSGLIFDPPRGIYKEPTLTVTISHKEAAAVRYTLDGSDPRSADALTGSLPLSITVDPTDTAHRHTAPGVTVRAVPDGYDDLPGNVATHTYLFPDQAADLSPDGRSPGPRWPDPRTGDWGSSGQWIDYGLDPDVTGDPEYADRMVEALEAIPSVALSFDLEALFDPDTGIYVNAGERGEAWERPVSVELLRPDGGGGFQANAGLRIRGGFSRKPDNPKHAFRLIFRGDYGTPKLRYPLFGDEGADAFDKIDLRTSQNYSWSVDGAADFSENTMNRDVFSRDLQRELGRPYTRSRYYHLYLNGVYWGLFQTQERSEAKYAETYFGGDDDDYDVIKVSREVEARPVIEAVDGTLDAWRSVWELCETGFSDDAAYRALEGLDAAGDRDEALPVLVDVDNLIDYMLVIFYTANFDAPASKWFENQSPNNFYAIRNRTRADQGFVFFAHDNEHTLLAEAVTITTGVDEDRVGIGEPGGAADDNGNPSERYRMSVTSFEGFHPQWLHHRLSGNAAYRQRFADRARAVLAGGGPLTPGKALPLFEARADELDPAIIAESARWGDAQRPEAPRTRNDDWLPAVDRVRNRFIPERTGILISQLGAVGLY